MGRYKSLTFLFLIAIIFRLTLIKVAYHGDLNNNISWATLAVERGLNGFYGSPDSDDWPYSAPNQPPLTILLLAGIRVIWTAIENISWWLNNQFSFFPSGFIWFWEGSGMILLMKLPSIIADLGIGWLIYRYINQKSKISKAWPPEMVKNQREKRAFILTSVWLFNPVTWYNSSVWGQTDSIVNLLGLAGVFALFQKNLAKFAVFMTLSLLFKGSLAIFIPILLLVAFMQRHSVKKWILATCYVLAVCIIVSIWFHPQPDLPLWLIKLYKERILPGEIGYLTANSFNLWWLINPGKVYDSVNYLGISARIWGIISVFVFVIFILRWVKGKVTQEKVLVSLALVSLASFLFLTRIHERYLYPFFPYATFLIGGFSGLWPAYLALSLTHLMNLYNLFWAPPIPVLEAIYQKPWFGRLLSVINITLFIYILRYFRRSKI